MDDLDRYPYFPEELGWLFLKSKRVDRSSQRGTWDRKGGMVGFFRAKIAVSGSSSGYL